MNPLRIWWADTRGKVIATLLFLWIATLIHAFQPSYLINPIVAVVALYNFDLIVSKFRTGHWIATMSSMVTGLLIGLVFDPTAPLYFLILACFITVLGKQFFAAGSHQHVWNPAVFGIAATTILFNQSTGWWAASWGMAPLAIIFVGMMLSLSQIRRQMMPLIFLAVLFLFFGVTGTWNSALQQLLNGTYVFFAFIMLPEPVTSISGKVWLYAWPALVGGLVILLTALRIYITDPVFLALLLANAAVFVFVRRKRW